MQKMQQTLEMLAQANSMVRKELHSPVQTDKPSFGRSNDKKATEAEGDRNEKGVLKFDNLRSLSTNITMVSFISSRSWARINQLSCLKGDVLAEEAEWAVLTKDFIEPLMM